MSESRSWLSIQVVIGWYEGQYKIYCRVTGLQNLHMVDQKVSHLQTGNFCFRILLHLFAFTIMTARGPSNYDV